MKTVNVIEEGNTTYFVAKFDKENEYWKADGNANLEFINKVEEQENHDFKERVITLQEVLLDLGYHRPGPVSVGDELLYCDDIGWKYIMGGKTKKLMLKATPINDTDYYISIGCKTIEE